MSDAPHSYRTTDPVIGAEVSGYRVTSRLGAGGMGIVYEGQQPVIGKRVAIKVLRQEVADDPDLVQRLVAEARAVNQVGHRGIIDVFAFGQLPDGRQCIVMELLDGEPLENVLQSYAQKGQRLPLGDVLMILDEVLAALSAAHSAGVVHRDLKPSNIFLCLQRDGTKFVKLLDFGIAKLGVLSDSSANRASMMIGTPTYMAPEQASGGRVGPQLDLYAVGVMAFELLTGMPPFAADSVVELLLQHASAPPPHLPDGFPREVDALLQRLLAKAPDARPGSADAVRAELEEIRSKHPHSTTLTVTVQRAARSTAAEPPSPARPDPNAHVSTAVLPARERPSPAEPSWVAARASPVWALAAVALVGLAGVAWLMRGSAPEPAPVVVAPPPAPPATPPVAPVQLPVEAPVPSPPPSPPPQKAVTRAEPQRPRESPTDARVRKLETALQRSAQAGEDVAVLRRLLQQVKARAASASTPEQRQNVEIALSRLEAELEPP